MTMGKRILVAVVFVPVLFVIMFILPALALGLTMALIAALACFELLRAAKIRDSGLVISSVVSAAIIPMLTWLINLVGVDAQAGYVMSFLLMQVIFVLAIRAHGTQGELPFQDLCVCLFGGVLIPTFLSALVELRMMPSGKYWVLLPVIVAFLTDGGAYFAGIFLGKHRGITNVSPNKSLEGYLGGVISGPIFCIIYGIIVHAATGMAVNFWYMILYGLVGSLVTELGDLAFSLIKRQLGVKDYGHLLPGHGGMLDRFDSMIFAAPLIYILVQLFPAF
jgi:phosphatidate cytidylyltransferase